MQSQTFFGSDSRMHKQLMECLPAEGVAVSVACNRGSSDVPSDSLAALSQVPGLGLLPIHFGPTLNSQSWLRRGALLGTVPRMLLDGVRLARFIRRSHVSVIHGTEKPRDAFYAVLLAKATGAKAVVHLHVKLTERYSWMAKWAVRHADAVIGVSPFVAESAVGMGARRANVFSVVNGLDPKAWDPNLSGRCIRSELGIPAADVVFMISARIFEWKGHRELIQAFAKLHRSRPDSWLLIVGEDDPRAHPGKRPFTPELKMLAKNLGVQDRVIFTGFRQDVAQLLAASDVFAMPTFEEPCAVAFLEAMAMGLPVIATKSGGTDSMVVDGETGVLVEHGDISALAHAMETLAADPELRASMGWAGRARLLAQLTPTHMARNVAHIYRTICAPWGEPS